MNFRSVDLHSFSELRSCRRKASDATTALSQIPAHFFSLPSVLSRKLSKQPKTKLKSGGKADYFQFIMEFVSAGTQPQDMGQWMSVGSDRTGLLTRKGQVAIWYDELGEQQISCLPTASTRSPPALPPPQSLAPHSPSEDAS